MRILLINHYAGSLEMGMEYRPYYLGREWVKNGHEVTVIAASFAHVRKNQPVVSSDFQEENLAGIRYVYLKTPRYEGNGLRRILNMFVFVSKLLYYASRISRTYRPDVVIASSTYPLDNYPARKIARKCSARHAYEVHDLWPLSPMELGGFSKHHPFIRIMQRAEDYACKNTDLLISMLPKTLPHLQEHGLDEKKWHYVPNGVVVEDWEKDITPPKEHLDRITDLKQKGFILIGYTGSVGLANALDNLILAAHRLKDENFRFIIIGDGPEKGSLEKKVQELKLTNVIFLPPVPKGCLPALFKWFDALYIGWQRVALYRFGVSPNKLLDYMMGAKPVIHAIDAGNDLVAESGCGISVEPENPEALADGIRNLFALDADERIRMGVKGKEYVSLHHDYKNLAKAMSSILETREDQGS